MLGRRARVACSLCHHFTQFTTRLPNVLVPTIPRAILSVNTLSVHTNTRQQSTLAMFRRAVAKHNSDQVPSKPVAAPFAPKPPSQQKDIHSAFKTQRSGYSAGGASTNALKNSKPQAINAKQIIHPRPTSTSSSSVATAAPIFEPPKGTDKDIRLLKTFNNDTAFLENAPLTEVPSVSSSIMTGLHEAVYFNEDDFDDDIDFSLDFNVDDHLISRDLKAAVAASIPTSSDSTLPEPLTPQRNPPNSSAPLPWSSSPIRHFHPIPAPRRPTGMVFSQESVSQKNVAASRPYSVASTGTRPVKRSEETLPPREKPKRRLPWLKQSEGKGNNEEPEAKKPRNRKPREKSVSRTEPETPRRGPSMPWETTASAVKAAQQEYKVKSTVLKRSNSKAVDSDIAPVVKKHKEQVAPVFLSEEQQRVIDLVLSSGKSVFFTGSAGTGKSLLLRELIFKLRQKHQKEMDRVAVTASTGLAACNIGGVTLHSFAGIGLGKEAPADLVKKIKRNPKAKVRWLRTKVLIIDEVSMVDGELFDKLESVARQIKNNGRPFGGIQLVITGDFFQLPPVPDNNRISKFAFEADTWNTSIDHTIGLTQVFRQRDATFADMLNEIRLGRLCQKTIDSFRSLHRPLVYNDGIQATELFPTRSEVDAANNAKMRQLAGNVETFEAIDGGTTADLRMRDKLLNNCMAPQRIDLKINSQVMLIKNIDETLVNGSLGRVVGFMNDRTFELLTSEGSLDDYINGKSEEDTQLMGETTALSRRNARLKAQLAAQAAADTSKKWPLVQFVIPDGTTRQLLVQPEQWKVELPNGEVQASRSQIPLILAWALSIHKAQGQTLERVKVDLGKVFEKGQAYVALSRATCQEGLQVLRFDPSKVMAHEKVRVFYASLYSAIDASTRARKAIAQKLEEEAYGSGDDYDYEERSSASG